MTHTNHDWTADPRVAPILARIAKNGAPITHFDDFSDSSNGKKTYWRHSGPDVDALKAVFDEYANAAWKDQEAFWDAGNLGGDNQPASLFNKLPTVEDIVRFVQSKWIDYRGSDRAGYFAKMDAAYPVLVAT